MTLPVYGTKIVIKNRLTEYLKTIEEEDNNERSEEDETDEVEELARNGEDETEEVEELARNGEDDQDLLSKFSVMKKDELIAECRSRKLTIRGNKDALAKRLAEYQEIIIIIVVLVIGTFISRAIFGNNK